jgi:hypothetical protein
MLEVINLALPFFGLTFLGLGCGKFKAVPDAGLAWMDFFILYMALPALFYQIVAQTPLEQLANPRFIVSTMLATFCAFAVSFAIGMVIRRGQMAESTIVGLVGGYGNIGYMGPGLALATLGSEATAPVALIFCFDNILLFFNRAVPDDACGERKTELRRRADPRDQARHAASADGRNDVRSALSRFALRASCSSRPLDTVPAKCRGANGPVYARRHRGLASAQ